MRPTEALFLISPRFPVGKDSAEQMVRSTIPRNFDFSRVRDLQRHQKRRFKLEFEVEKSEECRQIGAADPIWRPS